VTIAVVAHAVALASVCGLGWRILRTDATPARTWFLPFVALVAWWSFTATAGAVTAALGGGGAQAWERLAFVGAALAPVAWLAFVDAFIGHGGPRRARAALLALVPLATIAIALAEPHLGWLLTTDASGATHRGPWFWWVHVPYGYALLTVGAVIVWRGARARSMTVRRQLRWLLAAVSVPIVGNLLDLAGWRPVPGVQLTVVGFVAATAALAFAITARRFLRLPPTSYRERWADAASSVLFLDAERRVLDRNAAAARLLPHADDGAPPLGRLLPSVAAALDGVETTDGPIVVHAPTLPGRAAAVTLEALREGSRPPYGYVLVIDPRGAGSAPLTPAPPSRT
jgi:hypothetical protein